MKLQQLTLIDIIALAATQSEKYINFPLTQTNDQVIRMSVMTAPYHWHFHPNSDESFLVMEGSLIIELEDRMVELSPGQLFTIPKNVRHRTRPGGERSVNITFESADLTTVAVAKE